MGVSEHQSDFCCGHWHRDIRVLTTKRDVCLWRYASFSFQRIRLKVSSVLSVCVVHGVCVFACVGACACVYVCVRVSECVSE